MKRFILSIGFAASVVFAHANPVSVQTAQTVAANFLSNKEGGRDLTLQLTKSYAANAANGQTALYVFNVNNGGGFVIVSGDDAVMPVLAYSTEDAFPEQVTNKEVAYWMAGYNEQISYVIANHLEASASITQQWNVWQAAQPKQGNTAAKPTDVAPMLTTKWDQMSPTSSTNNTLYNNFCPTATPTGCVATAMAQIMNYWETPAIGTGSHSYNTSPIPSGVTLSANFDTTYDWANMPDQLHNSSTTTQKNAIALLMYHCGVAVEMNYDLAQNGGSGAYVINNGQASLPCAQNALKNYFGYGTDIKGLKRTSYPNDSIWTSKLTAEIDAGRPLLYTGTGSAGGHAFVFDGYQLQSGSTYFHVNWGWSGSSNGYFVINSLAPAALGVGGGGGNFNSQQQALINIHPAGISPNLTINAGLTASATSIAPGAAFTVATNLKNTGTGDFTNGSLVGGVYNAAGTTIVGYMQILTNQTLVTGGTMNITCATTGIAAMVPGTYIVKILYKGNPTDANWTPVSNGSSANTVTITVASATGIAPITGADNIHVYPNPARDFVMIDWKGYDGAVKSLQAVNMLGQVVWSNNAVKGTELNVPLSQFQTGIYMVNIATDKGTVSKKIVVQK